MGPVFVSPCPFVTLDNYDWHSVQPYHSYENCSPLPWNPVVYCFIAASHAVTYALTVELMLQLFFRFRRRSSLYFWSILACVLGTIMVTISLELRLFAAHTATPVIVIINLGTLFMVNGFNLTVYSRLNLITQNKTLLQAIFVSIFGVGSVGVISQALSSTHAKQAYRISLYMDLVFTVEILVIGGLYIYLFRRNFMSDFNPSRRVKSAFRLIILAQLVVAICDLIANVLLTMNYYLPITTIFPLRFAIKVKIEFAILNRLVSLAQSHSSLLRQPYMLNDISCDVEKPDPSPVFPCRTAGCNAEEDNISNVWGNKFG